MSVFGTDYDTPDGTCVRDYIHVADLASAHLSALRHLRAGGGSEVLNCGYGRGASVREVIAATERVSGARIAVTDGPRRAGDPPLLVSDASRIRRLLDWTPRHQDLDGIVADALAWERRQGPST
jgi:UDP-glucose 4-epimerase